MYLAQIQWIKSSNWRVKRRLRSAAYILIGFPFIVVTIWLLIVSYIYTYFALSFLLLFCIVSVCLLSSIAADCDRWNYARTWQLTWMIECIINNRINRKTVTQLTLEKASEINHSRLSSEWINSKKRNLKYNNKFVLLVRVNAIEHIRKSEC